MLTILQSHNPALNIAKNTAKTLKSHLLQGERVLWLLAGGSAIDYYNLMSDMFEYEADFSLLSIALGDERYSKDPLHEGATWPIYSKLEVFKQLILKGSFIYDVLSGGTLQREADRFDSFVKQSIFAGSYILSNQGIGVDGHTAGIIPIEDLEVFADIYKGNLEVVGHTHGGDHPERITITPNLIDKVDSLYVYAVGDGKRDILKQLYGIQKGEIPTPDINNCPLILLVNNSAQVFTDQIIN